MYGIWLSRCIDYNTHRPIFWSLLAIHNMIVFPINNNHTLGRSNLVHLMCGALPPITLVMTQSSFFMPMKIKLKMWWLSCFVMRQFRPWGRFFQKLIVGCEGWRLAPSSSSRHFGLQSGFFSSYLSRLPLCIGHAPKSILESYDWKGWEEIIINLESQLFATRRKDQCYLCDTFHPPSLLYVIARMPSFHGQSHW